MKFILMSTVGALSHEGRAKSEGCERQRGMDESKEYVLCLAMLFYRSFCVGRYDGCKEDANVAFPFADIAEEKSAQLMRDFPWTQVSE